MSTFQSKYFYNDSNVCFYSDFKIELKPKLTTFLLIRETQTTPQVPQPNMKLKLTASLWNPLIYLCLKEDLGIKKLRNRTVGENTWTLSTGIHED